MIVVDNTVLADFVLGAEPLQRSATALVSVDPDWISVGLWRYEFGNVVWKILRYSEERTNPVEVARAAFAEAESILSGTIDVENCSEVFQIASESGLTFYDAAYVWLALSRELRLYTRDKEILRKYPEIAAAMPD